VNRPRPASFHPESLLLVFAGWLNRHQLTVVDYLQDENQSLRERPSNTRIRDRADECLGNWLNLAGTPRSLRASDSSADVGFPVVTTRARRLPRGAERKAQASPLASDVNPLGTRGEVQERDRRGRPSQRRPSKNRADRFRLSCPPLRSAIWVLTQRRWCHPVECAASHRDFRGRRNNTPNLGSVQWQPTALCDATMRGQRLGPISLASSSLPSRLA
jgi:hypothetical protein